MAFDSVLPPFLHLLLLFFNVKLQQTTPRRSRAFGPPVFSLRCCWIKAFFVIFIVCACCAQDAAGEELRGAAVLFRDSVWAGGHPAVQSARQFYSSGCQLQNRGEDQPAEVDAPRSAGNASPGFGEPDSGAITLWNVTSSALWGRHVTRRASEKCCVITRWPLTC